MLKRGRRRILRHHELGLMTDSGQKKDDFNDGDQRKKRDRPASRKPPDNRAGKQPGSECGRQLPGAVEGIWHGRFA
ncbi:hypothetical protein [Dyella sp. AtDHG13]|uniref:hypothetical protein n=1 Tax=Dyella sp. AtDHG13 TaxID=1938897 RepID=UPI001F352982|nr:hypothetical protein [Dyella sp. AtDHG13]